MENVDISFGYMVLWILGVFCGHLTNFPGFGLLYQEKSGNPDRFLKIFLTQSFVNFFETEFYKWDASATKCSAPVIKIKASIFWPHFSALVITK
jgi:hypothetical protein